MTVIPRNLSSIQSDDPKEAIETIKQILQHMIRVMADQGIESINSRLYNIEQRISAVEVK